MTKITEKMLENQIIQWLNLQAGCYAFKLEVKGTWNPTGKFFQRPGRNVPIGGSDIVGIYNSKFFALEVKTPLSHRDFINHPGPHELRQQEFMKLIKAKGGIAEVVSSVDQVQELFWNWALQWPFVNHALSNNR